MRKSGCRIVVAGSLVLIAMLARPMSAQGPPAPGRGIDLSGEWAPRFHEDQPERIPGPDIGDYLGLPINAAGRLHADSWERLAADPARVVASRIRPTTRRAVRPT
jgi:hypothetical protein